MSFDERSISYNIKREPGSILTIDVQIDSSKRDEFLNEAYKSLVNRVVVPGFRKGKAPRPILEKFLGEDFYREAIRLAIRSAYKYIISKENIKPYTDPDYTYIQENWNENENLNFSIKVEIFPDIKVGQYKGLNYELKDVEVSEEEFNKFLEQLKLQNSKLKPIDDREIGDGDLVYVERETKDGIKLEPLWIRLNGSYDKEIEKELIGMKIGEQKIIETKISDDYPDTKLAGKVIPVIWRINKAWSYDVISDEELAQKLGYSNVEEMYSKIKEALIKNKSDVEKEKVYNEIVNKIIEDSEIDPPETLVLTVAQAMFQELFNDLARSGKDFEDYLKEIGMTKEQFIEEIKERARKRIQLEFIFEHIAQEENIKVTEEEIDEYLSRFAEEENKSVSQIKEELERSGDLKTLEKNLLRSKIVEFLIEENTKKGEG